MLMPWYITLWVPALPTLKALKVDRQVGMHGSDEW